jgi:hypothetical protein
MAELLDFTGHLAIGRRHPLVRETRFAGPLERWPPNSATTRPQRAAGARNFGPPLGSVLEETRRDLRYAVSSGTKPPTRHR